MKTFIPLANHFGKSRTPCLFFIDFEKQSPKIFALDKLEEEGIYFQLPRLKNCPAPLIEKKVQFLEKFPIAFESFLQAFNVVQEGLRAGNSYLLNLTFPTEIKLKGNLESLFHQANAPFKLYVKDQFVCFSPEPFVKTKKDCICTFPMKGTIKTDLKNFEKDKKTLLQNSKEQREHFTIVDLMRNDLARVATKIQVKRFRYVEEIPTKDGIILQSSSEIEGELPEHWQDHLGDLLNDLLPAGSISGAPKESTLEIIRNAEQQPRGYYTGVFGVFDGENIDTAVMIRFVEKRGEKYFFKSGGGITLLSDPKEEYQELTDKVVIPE